ncbi:hypothetical protein BOO25_21545 [Vibrio navarrensis]|uniref:hypothetical protein n=1 Tax=Vibrio navarrensis TaxID=29495 RepID=UPI00192FA7F1|nr:hypothetical protein [Vibrio navarrensis]MBE3671496.1 hypothetical protein [Vibrio navarrensis]
MFSKQEVKAFLIKLGRKWFFPDFANKVTWFVVTLGASIILAPIPLKQVILNFLIESFNLNSGELLTLAELGSTSADYWLGFALIAIALAHNVFCKWLVLQECIQARADSEKAKEVDRKLFSEFISLLPSTSGAAQFLEQHDFGNTFDLSRFHPIDQFVYDWNCPEKTFLDESLESIKMDFWNKSSELSILIGRKTGPLRSGRQSVLTEEYLGAYNIPEEYEEDIKLLNQKATDLFQIHQKLTSQCRKKLVC